MNSELVIDKIRKLFALAQSDNEAEASLASEKAHALLKAHNLSLSDLEEKETARLAEEEYFSEMRTPVWKRKLLQAVARSNYCEVVWFTKILKQKRGRRKRSLKERRYCVVGREHNAIGTRLMSDYLFQTIERMASRREGYGKAGAQAYRLGIVATLSQRLEELRRKDLEDAASRALMVREDALLAGYMARVRTVRTAPASVADLLAYKAGQVHGKGISLNNQLASRGSPQVQRMIEK